MSQAQKIINIALLAAAVVMFPIAASAQTQTGNMAADAASAASMRSAFDGYGPTDISPKARAEKQRVSALIEQYQGCRASAREHTKDKATKQNIRAQCVRTY